MTARTNSIVPLSAVSEHPPRRSRRELSSKLLLSLWLLYLVLDRTVSGRWWLWELFDLIPPVVDLLLACVVVVACVGLAARRRSRLAWAGASIVLVVVVLNFETYGISLPGNVHANGPGDEVHPSITVGSWNTEYWHEPGELDAFYGALRDLDADVLLLQEHLNEASGEITSADHTDELLREMPDYDLVVQGELVTLSRLPILDSKSLSEGSILRTKVLLPSGQAVALYNVHVAAPLDPGLPLIGKHFYDVLVERHQERTSTFDVLEREIDASFEEVFVAGDFNATVSSARIRALTEVAEAARPDPHRWYENTWEWQGLRLWRLDWSFGSPGIEISDYRTVEPVGLSDHRIQVMNIRSERN